LIGQPLFELDLYLLDLGQRVRARGFFRLLAAPLGERRAHPTSRCDGKGQDRDNPAASHVADPPELRGQGFHYSLQLA
jgi:hypothetical protein